MSAIITIPGENLIALCQGQGRHLNIDKMIFANVPDIDPEAAIDRSEQKPASELIVHESIIPDEYKAYVNPNQVVYSTVLDSSTGNYEFNWIGLYCSEEDVVVAITTLPKISKWKTEGQVQGNHLTRNFMLEFTGASECTGMSVTADTWQLDFSARLNSIDERERLSSRDTYGRARFWKDGYKVMHTDSGFVLSAGVGYVEGIRIDLEENLPIPGDTLPKSVWLDVSYKLQGSNVIAIATPVYGNSFSDYTKDAINHYVVKLAEISEVGLITDFRTVDNIESDLVEYLKKQVTDHNLDLDAHSELLSKLATGIPEILSPTNESTEIGETPVFLCSEFVPVFVNTTMTASQWQIDFNSEDFSSPIYDSGSTSSALTSLELPAGYLQVSTLYKARCRRRLNTGQWSPWSDIVSFTTRDVFNYVKRPVNVAPADGATSVPEKPILKSGPFSIVGDMTDTLEATQFRIRKGGNILHISPEIAGSMEYVLPAGLLVVFSDYTLECRQKGTELGWSDWSTPTSFRTATAFITGDEAVYPNSWVGHDNATVAGLALDDGAELRSNGTDQEEDEGDWVQYSVRAKVRDEGVNLFTGTTATRLKTLKEVAQGESLLTDHGLASAGVVNTSVESIISIADPFNDKSGIALYSFNDTLVGTGARSSIVTQPNPVTYITGKFGKAIKTNKATILDVPVDDIQHATISWWTNPSLNLHTGKYQLSWLQMGGLCGPDFGRNSIYIFGKLLTVDMSSWHNLDAFIHLCAVSNGTSGDFYINGQLIASTNEIALTGSNSLTSLGYGSSLVDDTESYDQLRVFNRSLTLDEVDILYKEEATFYLTDISSAGFTNPPKKVHKAPSLTSATGSAGTEFTSTDFTEIPTDSVSLGTDADPDNPNYVLLESSKQSPAESFRRVALGVKGLAKDSECRVTETQIDMWKKAATEGDNILSPTSWEIHDKASVEGLALEENAVLGSNAIDQVVGGDDWNKYTVTAKMREDGLNILSETTKTSLVTTTPVKNKDELLIGSARIIADNVITSNNISVDEIDPFNDNSGLALYKFESNLIGEGPSATTLTGTHTFVDGRFGQGVYIAPSSKVIDMPTLAGSLSWWTNITFDSNHDNSSQSCFYMRLHYYLGICTGTRDQEACVAFFEYLYSNRKLNLSAYHDGKYHHFCQTYSNGSGQLYIDGELAYSGTYTPSSNATEKLVIGDGANNLKQNYDQLRLFNRALTKAEATALFQEEIKKYTIDISTAELAEAPVCAYILPKLTAATGITETTFTAENFKEIPIESATFGADSDPVHPNYLTLKSTTQTPAESFRRVALGLNGLAKDSECRVAETQIEVKKKVSIPDTDGAVAPTSWEIHESASTEGVALEDGAVLGSNGVDQGTDETDWTEYSMTAKVRDNGLNVRAETTNSTLITVDKVLQGNKYITDLGIVIAGETSEIFSTADQNQIPVMTAATTEGCSISLENADIQGEVWWLANDNQKSAPLIHSTFPADIYIKFDTPIKIHQYTVANSLYPSANIAAQACMTAWTLKGKLLNGDWVLLDTQNSSLGWEQYKAKKFSFDISEGVYDSFCFHITEGTTYSGYTYIGPIEFIGKKLLHSTDISSGDFPSAPTKAHKMPVLTSATGAAGTAFTANSFTELPIETATIGKDSDAEHPDYILLKSEKQIPKESFRRVALGVKDLAKDSECRVAETQIDTWKQGA